MRNRQLTVPVSLSSVTTGYTRGANKGSGVGVLWLSLSASVVCYGPALYGVLISVPSKHWYLWSLTLAPLLDAITTSERNDRPTWTAGLMHYTLMHYFNNI